ncbi:MAG: hypothetical protein J07HX5_00477 [halophilic archaeon J07HX5]|nr:MAG: hypothetical protein J07HX5_00477 [halophilic archaeon J07HX5]
MVVLVRKRPVALAAVVDCKKESYRGIASSSSANERGGVEVGAGILGISVLRLKTIVIV